MADIAMCNGINCPMKKDCYRHTATPNERWQTMISEPIDLDTLSCSYFWDNKPYKKLKEDNGNPNVPSK